jgi:hypothetical protein
VTLTIEKFSQHWVAERRQGGTTTHVSVSEHAIWASEGGSGVELRIR